MKMNSHELAKWMLSLPGCEVTASVDIITEELDGFGDVVVEKIFAKGLCDYFKYDDGIVLHFEEGE